MASISPVIIKVSNSSSKNSTVESNVLGKQFSKI